MFCSYYSGTNTYCLGFNLAESVNFVHPTWVKHGKAYADLCDLCGFTPAARLKPSTKADPNIKSLPVIYVISNFIVNSKENSSFFQALEFHTLFETFTGPSVASNMEYINEGRRIGYI